MQGYEESSIMHTNYYLDRNFLDETRVERKRIRDGLGQGCARLTGLFAFAILKVLTPPALTL